MTNQSEPGVATTGVLRSAQRLLTRKGRSLSGRFLVEGRQAVREALGVPGLVERVLVVDTAAHADLLADAPEVFTTTPDQMRRLSDTVTPQGIVAVCRDVPVSLSQIVTPRLVVICAAVRDPGNAGTVIRCADAFGADAVILTTDSVELHNPKTIRASVGSIFHLPVINNITADDAVAWCREQGLQVLAADGGGRPLTDVADRLSRPTAWLMGNEAWGLPAEHSALADVIVGVPMWGRAESLNLSTAAAICLYESAAAQNHSSAASSPER